MNGYMAGKMQKENCVPFQQEPNKDLDESERCT